MSQEREVTTGIVGVDLHREARQVPDDAPADWGASAGLKHVGRRAPRLDGIEKVTGRARYTTDVRLPGMLYGRVLRSPHAHANVRHIDPSPALRQPGVKAVVVLDHVLGTATEEGEGSGKGPTPVPQLRYAGQPIAAVAATTPEAAEAALLHIVVDYEVLPHAVTAEDALREGAPLVFRRPVKMEASAGGGGAGGGMPQHGNLRGPKRQGRAGLEPAEARRRVEAALAGAHAVVRGTYLTQVQTHSALEPHGLVAQWSSKSGADELTVWASTQGIFSVRDELAEVLGLKQSQVRVITDYCGGGFGAKFGAGNYGVLAAKLARQAGAPVRLCLNRQEEHESVGNRPGSRQEVALGADREGRLVAIQVQGYGTGGAGAGAGFAGPAQNLYRCDNIYTEESDVFTHTGPLAAFRAPGHPQGAFALEQAMDELAERLGIDPLELRERNDPLPARREERKRGAAAIGWQGRSPAGQGPAEGPGGSLRRGIGVAQGVWYYLINRDSHAEVRLHRDGSIELLSGVQDIGGGIRTPLAQVVAEELGVSPQQVRVTLGDTRLPPGPGSGGSVTTASITPAARDAAHAALLALRKELATVLALAPERIVLGPGGQIEVGGQAMTLPKALSRMRKESVVGSGERQLDYTPPGQAPSPGRSPGRRGVGQLGGVHFAQVLVDTATGVVRVERVVAAQDCGRPLNALLTESQVHGGVIQGLSYALFEERRMDRRTGLMLNANLEQYKIAGALDVPRIDVILLEELRGRSSTDAAGIGEPSTVPTAAAVANAVYNAIGVRVRELPITPARVLAALAARARQVTPGRPR